MLEEPATECEGFDGEPIVLSSLPRTRSRFEGVPASLMLLSARESVRLRFRSFEGSRLLVDSEVDDLVRRSALTTTISSSSVSPDGEGRPPGNARAVSSRLSLWLTTPVDMDVEAAGSLLVPLTCG